MSLEGWSDFCGFLSGAALLVTAWRNDGLYGFVDKLRASVDKAKAQPVVGEAKAVADSPAAQQAHVDAPPDKLAAPIVEALETELSKWGWVDRWALRAGAGLLLVSYAIKLFG